MPIPSFVQANAGDVITGASGTIQITGCTAGNVLIVHRLQAGSGANITYSGVTNCSDLAGGAGGITGLPGVQVGSPLSGAIRSSIGRVTANGTCSFDIVSSSGDDVYAQIYEFQGVSTGTTLATVIENGESTTDQEQGTNTTVTDSGTTTKGAQRLAVNLIAIMANQAQTAFSGETGGDWSKAATEFSSATGTGGSVGIQTAEMSALGTINGGTFTITSAPWGVTGFALIPSSISGAGDDPPIGFLGRGAGW